MNDTFVYLTSLPSGVDEIVVPCLDGFTVYVDENLSVEKQKEAYQHALEHIKNGDFDYDNVSSVHEMELKAHHVEPQKQMPPIMSQAEIQRRINNLCKRHKKLMRECSKRRKYNELLRQIGIRPDSERL